MKLAVPPGESPPPNLRNQPAQPWPGRRGPAGADLLQRLANFAPRRDERIALSDAVTYLIKVGILHVVEARGDYVADENANALYDIDDRRLGHLISAPFPPSLATTTEHLLYESRYGPWVPPQVPPFPDVPAASDDQVRLRARHRIMRILLDDPVLYLDQLSAAERSYLQQTIGGITNWVTEAGMVLGRRAEGWAAIDPDRASRPIPGFRRETTSSASRACCCSARSSRKRFPTARFVTHCTARNA